jgi:hypothetical protein
MRFYAIYKSSSKTLRHCHVFIFLLLLLLPKCTVQVRPGVKPPPNVDSDYDPEVLTLGVKFAGRYVLGGMIQTDPTMSSFLGRDFHKVPQGVNGSASYNAHLRLKNGREMVKGLPFPVNFWWSMYGGNCPYRTIKGKCKWYRGTTHN